MSSSSNNINSNSKCTCSNNNWKPNKNKIRSIILNCLTHLIIIKMIKMLLRSPNNISCCNTLPKRGENLHFHSVISLKNWMLPKILQLPSKISIKTNGHLAPCQWLADLKSLETLATGDTWTAFGKHGLYFIPGEFHVQ